MKMRQVAEGVYQESPLPDRVLWVEDPNSLTQAIGWLKFATADGEVYFRGQEDKHPVMAASGFRPPLAVAGKQKLFRDLRALSDNLFGAPCACVGGPYSFGNSHGCLEQVPANHPGLLVSGTYRAAIEPLLQHYGVKTRWLDVVDNVWVALWFACHRQVTKGGFAYHLKRSVAQEGPGAFAYIAVLSTGTLANSGVPGYRIGVQARLIDLRYCTPSVFLRPHAQHGLLMAPASLGPNLNGDLTRQVVAHIKVHLADALNWLGEGGMTSEFVLFPPAARDNGYRRLLQADLSSWPVLGSIMSYGPGY